MIIVGGAYSEEVAYPERLNPLGGSGIRAAQVLRNIAPTLITAVDERTVSQLAAVSHDWPNPPVNVGRDSMVAFDYLTPVSTPTIVGVNAKLDQAIDWDGDDALVFGMIEHAPSRRVHARRAVVDPQSPRGAGDPIISDVKAGQTVLSANAREVAALAGGVTDVAAAANHVLRRDGYEAVVVRCGARGSLVADRYGTVWSNASPTPFVWSLGTGDVFSAVLAKTWFEGASVREAAAIASTCTAWWSSTKNTVIPPALLAGESIYTHFGVQPPALFRDAFTPRIYLAGPFFSASERWLVETAKGVLEGLGGVPWSPFHQVGVGDAGVARKDIDGLRQCDVVFALLDGFDPGTVYELGWAHALGIPVVGYSSQVNDEANKMIIGMGGELHADLTSALYRAVWVGQGDNPRPGRKELPLDTDLQKGAAWRS